MSRKRTEFIKVQKKYLSDEYINLLYDNPSSFFSSSYLNKLLSEETLIDITNTSIFEHFYILKQKSKNPIYSTQEENFYSTLKKRFENTISLGGNSFFHFLCRIKHGFETMTQLILNKNTSLKSLTIKNKNGELFYQDIIRDYQILKPKNEERTKYVLFFKAIFKKHSEFFNKHISSQDKFKILSIIIEHSFIEEQKVGTNKIIKQLKNVKENYLPQFLYNHFYLKHINFHPLNYLTDKNKWKEANKIINLYQKLITSCLDSNKWLLSHIYYSISRYNLADKRTIAVNYFKTCFNFLYQITPEKELQTLYKAKYEGKNIFHYVFTNNTILNIRITKRVYSFICESFLNNNKEHINELIIQSQRNKKNAIKIPIVYLLFNFKGTIDNDFIDFWTDKAKLLSQEQMKKHFDIRYLATFTKWDDYERCKFYINFLETNQILETEKVHKLLPFLAIKSLEMFQLIYQFADKYMTICQQTQSSSRHLCCYQFYMFIIKNLAYYKRTIGEKWYKIIFKTPKNQSHLYKKKLLNEMNKQELKDYYKKIFKLRSFEEQKIHLGYIFNMYSDYLKNRCNKNKNKQSKMIYKIVNKNINLLVEKLVKNLDNSPLSAFVKFSHNFNILEILLRIIVSWEGDGASLLKKQMFLELKCKNIDLYIYLLLDNYNKDNVINIFKFFKKTFIKYERKTFFKNSKDLIEYSYEQTKNKMNEILEEEKEINQTLIRNLFDKWKQLRFFNKLMNISKNFCINFFQCMNYQPITFLSILEQGLSNSIYKQFKHNKNDSSLLPYFILNGYIPPTLTTELREKYNSLIKLVLSINDKCDTFRGPKLSDFTNLINYPFVKEHILKVSSKEEKPSILYILLTSKPFLLTYPYIFFSCMPIKIMLDLFDETYAFYISYVNIFSCLTYGHNKNHLISFFTRVIQIQPNRNNSNNRVHDDKLNHMSYHEISNKNSFYIFVRNFDTLLTSITTNQIINWITQNDEINYKFNHYLSYIINVQYNRKNKKDNMHLQTFISIIQKILDIYSPEYRDAFSQVFPLENNTYVYSKFKLKIKFLELYKHDFDKTNNFQKTEFNANLFEQRLQAFSFEEIIFPFFITRIETSNNQEEVKILCKNEKIRNYILTHDCLSVFPTTFGKLKRIDEISPFLNTNIETLLKHCSIKILTYLFKRIYKAIYKKEKGEKAIITKYEGKHGKICSIIKNFNKIANEHYNKPTDYNIVEFKNEIFEDSFLLLFKNYFICLHLASDIRNHNYKTALYIYFSYYPIPIEYYDFKLAQTRKSHQLNIKHFLCLFDKNFEQNIDKYELLFKHKEAHKEKKKNKNLCSLYRENISSKINNAIKRSFVKTKELFVNNSIKLFKKIGKEQVSKFFEEFPTFNESYCHLLVLISKCINYNHQKNLFQTICKITFDYIPTSIKYIMNQCNYDLALTIFPIMTVIKTSRIPQLQTMLPYLTHRDLSKNKMKTLYMLLTQIVFLHLNNNEIEEHINLSLDNSSIRELIKKDKKLLCIFICYSIYKDDQRLFDQLYTYWGFDNTVQSISKISKQFYSNPSNSVTNFIFHNKNEFSKFLFIKQHFNFIELMIVNQAKNVFDSYITKQDIMTKDDTQVRLAKLILRNKNISLCEKYENILSIINDNNENSNELLLEIFTLISKCHKNSDKNILNYLENKYTFSNAQKFYFSIEKHSPKKEILKYYRTLPRETVINYLRNDLPNENDNDDENKNNENQDSRQYDSGMYWWFKFEENQNINKKFSLMEKIIELNLYEIIKDLFQRNIQEKDKLKFKDLFIDSLNFSINFNRNKCTLFLLDIFYFPAELMNFLSLIPVRTFIQWLKTNQTFTKKNVSPFTYSKITNAIQVYDVFYNNLSSYLSQSCNYDRIKIILSLVLYILFSSKEKQIIYILQFLLNLGDKHIVYSTLYLLISTFKLQISQDDIFYLVNNFCIRKEEYLMYLIYLYEQRTNDIIINIDAISPIGSIAEQYILPEIKSIEAVPITNSISDNSRKIKNLTFVSTLVNKMFINLAVMWINEKKMFSELLNYSGNNEKINMCIKCITSVELFYLAYLLFYKIPQCMEGQQFNLLQEKTNSLIISHNCFSNILEYSFAIQEKYYSPDEQPTISNDKRFERSYAYYYIFTVKQEEMFRKFEYLNTNLYAHITQYVEELFNEIYSPLKPAEHDPSDIPFQEYVYKQNQINHGKDPNFINNKTQLCQDIQNEINSNKSTVTNPIKRYINNVIKTAEILKKVTTEKNFISKNNDNPSIRLNNKTQSLIEQIELPDINTFATDIAMFSKEKKKIGGNFKTISNFVCYMYKFLQEKNDFSRSYLKNISLMEVGPTFNEPETIYWNNLLSTLEKKYNLIIDFQKQLQNKAGSSFIIELEFFDLIDICESFIQRGLVTNSKNNYNNYMSKLIKAMMNLLMNLHRNTPLKKKLFDIIDKEIKIYNEEQNPEDNLEFLLDNEPRIIRFVCHKQDEILGNGQMMLDKNSKDIIDSIFKINIGTRTEKEGIYVFKENEDERDKCFEYVINLSWNCVTFDGNITEFIECVNYFNYNSN